MLIFPKNHVAAVQLLVHRFSSKARKQSDLKYNHLRKNNELNEENAREFFPNINEENVLVSADLSNVSYC